MDVMRYVKGRSEFVPWCIPMVQLTVLRLYGVPVNQCIGLLLHCPNLVEFHCVDSLTLEDTTAPHCCQQHWTIILDRFIISKYSDGELVHITRNKICFHSPQSISQDSRDYY
jgi:hypothetical protein